MLDIAAEAAWEVIDSKQYEIFKPAELGTDAYKYLFILEDVQSNPANIKKDKNKEYIFSRRHDEVIAQSVRILLRIVLPMYKGNS